MSAAFDGCFGFGAQTARLNSFQTRLTVFRDSTTSPVELSYRAALDSLAVAIREMEDDVVAGL